MKERYVIMKKFRVFVALSFPILGLLLVLTPVLLFPVCHYDSYMDCWGVGFFVMIMGMIIEFCGWYVNVAIPLTVCNVISSIAALMCFLVPYRIIEFDKTSRLCDDLTHACRTSTMPAVITIASLIILLNVSCIIVSFLRRNED